MIDKLAIGEAFYRVIKERPNKFSIIKCKLVGKVEHKVYGITPDNNYDTSYFFKEYRDDGSMTNVIEFQGNTIFKTRYNAEKYILSLK